MDAIDGAIAFTRADSASDRMWALATVATSLPLPGLKVKGPVAAVEPLEPMAVSRFTRPGSVLDAGGRAAAGTPDVYAISLLRRRGKEVTEADRVWTRGVADRLGHTGPVDVGHAPGHERVFTPPGQDVSLRPEPRGPNRAAGRRIARDADYFRKNPQLGVYVRPKVKK
jgi:hypothetical protein